MNTLELIVCAVSEETPLIRSLRLKAGDDCMLPGFEPGAHIRVSLPEGGDRAYSLINFDPEALSADGVSEYRIAVRLEEKSTGGSKFMHGLKAGDRIAVQPPRNDFPMVDGSGSTTLLAGGIGITPITGMVASLAGSGRDFSLHYAGRGRGSLAFVDKLTAIAGERARQHYDDEPDTRLDLNSLVGGLSPNGHLYICGPKGMIHAATSVARARGFADDHIHFELFTNQAETAAGASFEIELASTGEVLRVPDGKSIIEVLENAGHDVLHDCRRGDCGICQTEVISGMPDHRDVVLSDEEKSSGKMMQICVSRAISERLVLDL